MEIDLNVTTFVTKTKLIPAKTHGAAHQAPAADTRRVIGKVLAITDDNARAGKEGEAVTTPNATTPTTAATIHDDTPIRQITRRET